MHGQKNIKLRDGCTFTNHAAHYAFFLPFYNFHPFRPNIFLSTLLSNVLSLFSYLSGRDQSETRYQKFWRPSFPDSPLVNKTYGPRKSWNCPPPPPPPGAYTACHIHKTSRILYLSPRWRFTNSRTIASRLGLYLAHATAKRESSGAGLGHSDVEKKNICPLKGNRIAVVLRVATHFLYLYFEINLLTLLYQFLNRISEFFFIVVLLRLT